MWYEFPHDSLTNILWKQFMFGDSMLVAPKFGEPTTENIVYHAPYTVSVYLPTGVNWYYFYSGQPIPGQFSFYHVPIPSNEQGVWVKEGSIIPLLNFEQGRMSLMEAINDPINLMIYPNLTSNAAKGDLYLDDGETNNYLNGEYTQVQFNWDGAALIVTKTVPDNISYAKASGKFINKA